MLQWLTLLYFYILNMCKKKHAISKLHAFLFNFICYLRKITPSITLGIPLASSVFSVVPLPSIVPSI